MYSRVLVSPRDDTGARGAVGGLWTQQTFPRRVVGARVVLVEGTPVLYLEKGARKLLTFAAAGEPFKLERAVQALLELAPRLKGRCLRLEHIDGENAAQHPLAGAADGLLKS